MTRSVPAGAPQHLRSWRSLAGSHRTWVATLGMAALSATAWTAIAVMDDSTASVTAAQAAGTTTSELPAAAAAEDITATSEPELDDPTALFTEDFENSSKLQPNVPTLLSSYQSAISLSYTASNYWLDSKYCNGFITASSIHLSESEIKATWCGLNDSKTTAADYDAVRVKAYALGLLQRDLDGSTVSPADNHALSTNTSGGIPDRTGAMFSTNTADAITFQTSSKMRFIEFSVDSAETGTGTLIEPKMTFYLFTSGGASEQKLNASPMPDTSARNFILKTEFAHDPSFGSTTNDAGDMVPDWAYTGKYGRFYSDALTVDANQTLAGGKFGLKLVNTSTASSQGCGAYRTYTSSGSSCPAANKGTVNGNDGAIDNIRMVDATPTMDKSFSPSRVPVGETSTMTLTVKNRTDLKAKKGWSFVDTLPSGLTFANSTATVQCFGDNDTKSGATATVDGSKGTLTVTNGNLADGTKYCTITTTVTSSQANTFTNGSKNFTDVVGVEPPKDATVEFYPWIKVQKNVVSRWDSSDQFTVSATINDTSSSIKPKSVSSTTSGTNKGEQAKTAALESVAENTYTLEETMASGSSKLNDYTTTLSCVDQRNNDLPVEVSAVPGSTTKYTLKAPTSPTGGASEVLCTFTNTPKAKLTLVKSVNNAQAGSLGLSTDNWTLSALSGDSVALSGVSGADAVKAVTVDPGTYSLKEASNSTTLVDGAYEASDWTCRKTGPQPSVTVAKASVVLSAGDDVTCTITNTAQPGSVTWSKVDSSDASTLLSGSEWTLTPTNPSGAAITVIDDGRKDADTTAGKIKVESLSWGTYTLKETKAPAGYVLSDTEYTVTINGTNLSVSPQSNDKDVAEIKNTQAEVPDLPLTGGMSTDAFLLSGGGLLALAGLGGFIHRRRSLRVAKA